MNTYNGDIKLCTYTSDLSYRQIKLITEYRYALTVLRKQIHHDIHDQKLDTFPCIDKSGVSGNVENVICFGVEKDDLFPDIEMLFESMFGMFIDKSILQKNTDIIYQTDDVNIYIRKMESAFGKNPRMFRATFENDKRFSFVEVIKKKKRSTFYDD